MGRMSFVLSTNSLEATKETQSNDPNQYPSLICSSLRKEAPVPLGQLSSPSAFSGAKSLNSISPLTLFSCHMLGNYNMYVFLLNKCKPLQLYCS